jgi:hypothetical protein
MGRFPRSLSRELKKERETLNSDRVTMALALVEKSGCEQKTKDIWTGLIERGRGVP